MRLLLDTHVVLWWLADDAALSHPARAAIADPANEVYVSAASAWEIAFKRAIGKLHAPDDLEAALREGQLQPLAIMIVHALLAGALPPHHNDPFDRMLVAQASIEGLTLVTHDRRLNRYGVPILPV